MITAPRVEWSPTLPATTPSYYDAEGEPTIVLSVAAWPELSWAQWIEQITRECAQHLLGATYAAVTSGWRYYTACRQEERGRRLAHHCLVDDAAVLEAFVEGDREAHELAERWGRSPAWCVARVELFLVQHPEWRWVLRPE